MKTFCIKMLCMVLAIFLSLFIMAQDWVYKQADKQFIDRGLMGGLRVGDTIPDIPLGLVVQNSTGKKRFSDFRGKVVILDFWDINCATCIADFPKMKKLQDQFGDKIQVFLVNTVETFEQIQEAFEKKQKRAKTPGFGSPDFYKLVDLPLIVPDRKINSKEDIAKQSTSNLRSLFPIRVVPHKVLIDKDGVIRYRGGMFGSYPENIQAVLDGRPIFARNDENTTPNLVSDNWPLWKLMGHFKDVSLSYSSIITGFNNEYDAFSGGGLFNLTDTVSKTRRTTFVNRPVLEALYRGPWNKKTKIETVKILYGPIGGGGGYWSGSLLDLQVSDTLRYTCDYTNGTKRDDLDTKSKICYEQVSPLNESEELHWKRMQSDLYDYLHNKYGTEFKWEKRKVPAYALIRTSGKDLIASKETQPDYEAINKEGINYGIFVEKGVKMKRFTFQVLGEFATIFEGSPLENIFVEKKEGQVLPKYKTYILNETGFSWDKKIDIVLPFKEGLTSMDQLRKALNKYDLDLIKSECEIEFLVITDNTTKTLNYSLNTKAN